MTPASVRPQSVAQKYREIIISILLFIILDLGVLLLNFYVSFSLQDDAVSVNLAGRQRMLSQRTAKVLYQIQSHQAAGQPADATFKELKGSFTLFDTTLGAFDQGGSTPGSDDKPVTLRRVEAAEARQPLEDAIKIWTPYRAKLETVLSSSLPVSSDVLSDAITAADENNLKLLKLMNQLTTSLEQAAQAKAKMLRSIQTVAIVLVLINFIVIIVHVIGKLKRSDAAAQRHEDNLQTAVRELEKTNGQLATTSQKLIAAQAESTTIFNSVRQGIFLLKSDLTLGTQVSQEFFSIFQIEQSAGRNFLDLLRPYIAENLARTTADFLPMLFDPTKKDRQLQKFNPLSRIEANFSRPEGGFNTKHLEFAFQRIELAGKIDSVLVTVTDSTQRVNLENKLKESEERAKREFQLLFDILKVDAELLRELLHECHTRIAEINSVLRTTAEQGSRWSADKIEEIFRTLHTLKARASSLGLSLLPKYIHHAEEKLIPLRGKSDIDSESFLPVLLAIGDFQLVLDEASELITKVSGLRRSFAPAPAPASRPPISEATLPFVSNIESLCRDLAHRHGKNAEVKWDVHSSARNLPSSRMEIIRDVLLQLVRNSLAHGIETPDQRQRRNKAPRGKIEISLHPENGSLWRLRCRDDGAGLDLDGIRRKASEVGLISRDSTPSNEEICGLIFAPGFSTAAQANEDAGRGIGLDLVKQRVVDEIGGEIEIDFEPGTHCEFTLTLPA